MTHIVYACGNFSDGSAHDCCRVNDKLKKRLEECETNSNRISMKDDWVEYKFQMRLVPELKKLLGIKGWTDKHTKIVEESEEMFRTHKGEEADI